MLDLLVTLSFIITYLIMALGHIPKTKIRRTETALLAALIILLTGKLSLTQAAQAIEFPTLVILAVLMLISAQFKLANFYDWVAAKIANYSGSPACLLALVVIISGLLSAVLANDIIAFAMAPILCKGIADRNLDPKPFLFALMGACNAGSAATLIGNPQNILIGEYGKLSFTEFLYTCGPAALAALVVVYGVIWVVWHKSLTQQPNKPHTPVPKLNRSQSRIGVVWILVLISLFLTPIPRMYSALALGILLIIIHFNRAKSLLRNVDWRLIVLFLGLFLVNAGFESTGYPADIALWFQSHHYELSHLSILTPFAFIASNTIGNVPTVIMTLGLWHPQQSSTLYALALMTTLAGNACLWGSLANLIVAERANKAGCTIQFSHHLKAGLPITLLSMGAAWLWLTWHLL